MPTVLITGANRGIGLGLARAYHADGWRVIATCRTPEKAEALKALGGDNLEIYSLDVTDHAGIDALAEKLSGRAIDVLINNAGILGSEKFTRGGRKQKFGAMDYKGFFEVLRINTIGPLKVTEAFVDHIAASDQKKVIKITSAMGSLSKMEPGFIAYSVSKTAVNSVMRNIAPTLKEKGISVLLLNPGWVKTDMGSDAGRYTIAESVKGLKEQIEKLDLSSTGSFKNFKGETEPW